MLKIESKRRSRYSAATATDPIRHREVAGLSLS